MSEWIRSILDIALIAILGGGLVQATRLIGHLIGLRQSRLEMERFVQEFNSTVMRAEAGIKGLRMAARDSGDDLEKLVEKAIMVRDELQFITESADQLAERLSQSASAIMRPERADVKPEAPAGAPVATFTARKAEAAAPAASPASSRAEKELLQALQKLS